MSKLLDNRVALAQSIIAADIGWTEDTVLVRRQTDLFNDIVTALQTAKHGAILHIGTASAQSTDDDSLEMEVTIPLTIVCFPQVVEGATPEEDLWEDLVRHVSDLRLGNEHALYRLKFRSFDDIDIVIDGVSYLGRQTIFAKQLSL
jgi:hypothetical protein